MLSTHAQADRSGYKPRLSKHNNSAPYSKPNYNKYRRDNRYRHDLNYPRHGHYIDRLPFRRSPIRFRNHDYYYNRGIWYRPSGARFIISIPPIGIIVPTLPPHYATVWVRGMPYYYANDVYYTWRPNRNGYVVTQPPEEISQEEPPLIADELFIYPKIGQSEQQQADDRYSCHRWSVRQTRYDPTLPPENIAVSTLNHKREDYQRAMRACLEGKDYSVR